jgi:hypothetical protein
MWKSRKYQNCYENVGIIKKDVGKYEISKQVWESRKYQNRSEKIGNIRTDVGK